MNDERLTLTDRDLLYAATTRCRCGAGLAYPLEQRTIRAWVCSNVLKGDGFAPDIAGSLAPGDHDILPWVFWKVREETSINNTGGHTTRPPGTIARTIGKAKCPQCSNEWQSEPYVACDLGHHWFPGPCPECGYAVGGSGTYRTGDGPRIETRYRDVVLDVNP